MTFDHPVLAPKPGNFAFACNRCGNCCSNQSGFVWIREDEIARLAKAVDMGADVFARRHVRQVGDRLSLVEERGRCSLLIGKNECSVYTNRPDHCQGFPFWDSILTGGDDYGNARELCPGIFEVPARAARDRAYGALREFYGMAGSAIDRLQPRCQLSGDCCDFPKYGHQLYATLLEVDYAAEHGPRLGAAEDPKWCEFYRGRRCQARETRPLACRTFYCDANTGEALRELHESLLARLRALAVDLAYPSGYGDFVELLPARRAAIELLDASRGEIPHVKELTQGLRIE